MADRSWPAPVPQSTPRAAAVARRRRTLTAVAAVLIAIAAAALLWPRANERAPERADPRGTPAWALRHYGDPDARGFKRRKIVEIDFLGRRMWVHRGAVPHFLRLERLFEARAPEYAALVAAGEVDDWSYLNRTVSGTSVKSTHAFGIAIDINALANVRGTAGDIPPDVAAQWEAEGGDWGGDWTEPDPMHFETHLTPEEIRHRYRRDGTPRDWYLEELIAG